VLIWVNYKLTIYLKPGNKASCMYDELVYAIRGMHNISSYKIQIMEFCGSGLMKQWGTQNELVNVHDVAANVHW